MNYAKFGMSVGVAVCLASTTVCLADKTPNGALDLAIERAQSTAREGAIAAGASAVDSQRGDRVAQVPFDFGPAEKDLWFGSMSATTNAMVKYDHLNAHGGVAMADLGKRPNSFIEFSGIPAAQRLHVFYINHLGQPRQISLYINGEKRDHLTLPGTGKWFDLFGVVTYEGPVEGTVRFQCDEDDAAVNGGGFACNIDGISIGDYPARPSLELRVPLKTPQSVKAQTLSVLVQSPKDATFHLAFEDLKGVFHESAIIGRPSTSTEWSRFTFYGRDLLPPLDPEADGLACVRMVVEGDGKANAGNVAIGGLIASVGWPSTPPAGNPFEPSTDFTRLEFTGRTKTYTTADTWYPSRAKDGRMVSAYTDGAVSEATGYVLASGPDAVTGAAIVTGDDPLNLTFEDRGKYMSRPAPFNARYPCGSLTLDGIWYYGTYILDREGILGPFVGFRWSSDWGATWTETPHTPTNSLFSEFSERVRQGYAGIKMGSPHFVDFGVELEHSPDKKAYLVSHGGPDRTSPQTWILGDSVYLSRVLPSVETMNDPSAYEFFAGHGDDGAPKWSSSFDDLQPLVNWPQHAGCVTVTYVPGLSKYLMCVSTGPGPQTPFDTYILESDSLEGPWKMITYMEQFGIQAYFVNIPSAFMSEDGLTLWMCYSANWNRGFAPTPAGSQYGMCMQEFRLIRR